MYIRSDILGWLFNLLCNLKLQVLQTSSADYALYVSLKEFFIVVEKSFETKHNLFDVWSFKSTVKQLVQVLHWSRKLKKKLQGGGKQYHCCKLAANFHLNPTEISGFVIG